MAQYQTKRPLKKLPRTKEIRPKKAFQPTSYPWLEIEHDFVAGIIEEDGSIYYPTLGELSERRKVPYSSVRKRFNEGEWLAKREAWQTSLHQKIREQTFNDYILAARKFDASCIVVAQRGIDDILKNFDEVIANADNFKSGDLLRLSQSALNFQRMGRLVLGLSTENTAAKVTEELSQKSHLDVTLLSDEDLIAIESIIKSTEQRKIEQAKHVESKIENDAQHD